MTDVDYSDRAIALRIHQVSQLRKLCLSLAKASSGGTGASPVDSAGQAGAPVPPLEYDEDDLLRRDGHRA